MMMAALGLGGAKGEMRAAVNSGAAQRAKARGLGPRAKPKSYPVRTRYGTSAELMLGQPLVLRGEIYNTNELRSAVLYAECLR